MGLFRGFVGKIQNTHERLSFTQDSGLKLWLVICTMFCGEELQHICMSLFLLLRKCIHESPLMLPPSGCFVHTGNHHCMFNISTLESSLYETLKPHPYHWGKCLIKIKFWNHVFHICPKNRKAISDGLSKESNITNTNVMRLKRIWFRLSLCGPANSIQSAQLSRNFELHVYSLDCARSPELSSFK